MKDPRHAVVEETEGEEEVVEAGEHDQEVVERVFHVLRGEDVDGKTVAKEAEHADSNLAIFES